MAQLLELKNFRTGYYTLIREVLERGERMPSRVAPSLDVNDLMIEIADPRDVLPIGMNANFNHDFFVAEAAQLVAGYSFPKLMTAIAPATEQFLERNGTFYGAYGVRTRGQFGVAFDKLQRFPEDRQVVVTFWDKTLDLLAPQTRDHPCTLHMRFRVRNDKLYTTTVMRSNDVWLGVKYDVPMFCTVHLTMATLLDVPAGPYTHLSHSMHIYERDIPALENVSLPSPEVIHRIAPPMLPPIQLLNGSNRAWTRARETAVDRLKELEVKYGVTA